MNATKLAGAVVLSLAVGLSGCAASGPDGSLADTEDASPAPDFVGPFADEYLQVWRDSDSTIVHDVIADEQVSEQEWAEVTSRLSDCLAEKGMTFEGFDVDGSYSVATGDVGDRADALAGECEMESGSALIGYLRQTQIINPENRDFNEIIAECLVREGAVAAGYGADDFREDVPDMSFPYLDPDTGAKLFVACNSDPLSLLSVE